MTTQERQRSSEQLGVKSLRELQAHGMEHFSSMEYRTEVVRRVAKAHGATRAILFDDMADAASPNQKGESHRYERHLLPGLITATGFREGATVIVAAPPAPAEIEYVWKFKDKLEQDRGRPINYQVLYAQDDEVYDLMQIDKDDYRALQTSARTKPEDATSHGEQVAIIKKHLLSDAKPGEKALIVPYQTTLDHYEAFEEEIETGLVALPSVPQVDKAFNGLLLQEHGFTHLPKMYIIGSDGSRFERHEQLEEASKEAPIVKTPDVVDKFAQGITDAVESLAEDGMNAYIKLDPSGASGRGNLDPGHYPDLYNPAVDRETKQAIIAAAVQEMPGLYLPQQAIVEEFVEAREVEGIPVDVTICGEMVDGVFLPISINPVGTTHGAYDRQWTGPNAEAIGDDPEDWKNMFQVYADMGDVLTENGYTNGVLAGDVFQREDGTYAQHDYNFRRGGRSVPESLMVLEPDGWFDASVQIELTEGFVADADVIDAYHQICERLREDGMFPYATGLAYGDAHEPSNVRTFKVLRPMDTLVGTDGTPLQRDQHLEYTENTLLAVASSLRSSN